MAHRTPPRLITRPSQETGWLYNLRSQRDQAVADHHRGRWAQDPGTPLISQEIHDNGTICAHRDITTHLDGRVVVQDCHDCGQRVRRAEWQTSDDFPTTLPGNPPEYRRADPPEYRADPYYWPWQQVGVHGGKVVVYADTCGLCWEALHNEHAHGMVPPSSLVLMLTPSNAAHRLRGVTRHPWDHFIRGFIYDWARWRDALDALRRSGYL